MTKRSILAITAAAALAVPGAASAQRGYQGINQRQENQIRRIEQGVRSGELTRGEAQRLRGEFRALNRLEQRYRASNGLSAGERRDLDRRFDQLSRRIRDQKRDRQTRY